MSYKTSRSKDPVSALVNAGLDRIERAIYRAAAKVVKPRKQRKR